MTSRQQKLNAKSNKARSNKTRLQKLNPASKQEQCTFIAKVVTKIKELQLTILVIISHVKSGMTSREQKLNCKQNQVAETKSCPQAGAMYLHS
jgi:hypothetical protein